MSVLLLHISWPKRKPINQSFDLYDQLIKAVQFSILNLSPLRSAFISNLFALRDIGYAMRLMDECFLQYKILNFTYSRCKFVRHTSQPNYIYFVHGNFFAASKKKSFSFEIIRLSLSLALYISLHIFFQFVILSL